MQIHQSVGSANPPNSSGVILQYHHIADDTPAITSTSVTLFEKHLNYLAENNFLIWPLDKLIDSLENNSIIPDKVISITFDDAYENIYINAWPRLKEKGFPFTLFVATDLIGRRGYLSWNQIREMSASGLSIANHTTSHAHLIRKLENETPTLWQRRITAEITLAQKEINKELPNTIPQKYMAYPYGEYNGDLLELIKTLGYVGFGQQSGAVGHTSNLLSLPRFPLSGVYANFSSFVTKVHTRAMPLVTKKLLNPELEGGNRRPILRLEFNDQNFRFDQLACYGQGERITLKKLSPLIYTAQSKSDLPTGRSRYNCTMPVSASLLIDQAGNANRFYWFSQLWIKKNEDGSWYAEP